jgi:formylglycine-generating enzyme required for sulfatase activity
MILRRALPLLALGGLAVGCGSIAAMRPATVPPLPPGVPDPDAAATTAAPGPEGAATTAVPGTMVRYAGGAFFGAERVGPNADAAYYRAGPFELDATEVTVADYARCVSAGRCTPAWTTVKWDGTSPESLKRWNYYCNGDRADRADHPVNCVDWSQAQAYCAAVGKRLPTEEEWEWAARGAKAGDRYPWGDADPAAQPCWSGPGNDIGGRRQGTCPVASHPAGDTPQHVADLAGNVWEWTATETIVGNDSRGRGGSPARVARGGGWGDADPRDVTVGRRARNVPGDRGADLGFRCARSR